MSEKISTNIVNKPIVSDIFVGDTTITITGNVGQRATVTFQNGVTVDGLITESGSIKLVIPKYIKMNEGVKVNVRLKDGYKQSEIVEVIVMKTVENIHKEQPTKTDRRIVKAPKFNKTSMPKLKLTKMNSKIIRNILVVLLAVLCFFLIFNVTLKMSNINTIEKIGYSKEEATSIYEVCEDKNRCARDLQQQVDSEIKALEDNILASYQLEVANYDTKYQKENYKTLIEYKNALIEYQQLLATQKTQVEVPEVTQTPDENGCYVNIVNGYVVANKKYCMPASYDPGTNQEAYDQLLKMISDAKAEGISITILSGYRSYNEQVETYNYWVSVYGEEYASTISAKPGYSEHQTGLAFDLGDANNPNCNLEECFESTEAGIWLAQNAHEYGFIIRYPKGSESITGYAYEPWHFRYVGDIATDIYQQQTTLEQYLQVP